MNQFLQLFNSKFLFYPVPSPKMSYLPFLIFFGILVLAAIAISVFTKKEQKKIFGRYVPPLLTVGILGYVHLFARYESLPWFAARAFLGALFAAFLVWFGILVYWTIRFIPKYKKEKETENRYKKYLPKKV